MTLVLTRLGYQVDSLDDPAEALRLMEHAVYVVVVTNRAPAGKGETLYQRLNRLTPELRRRVFVILVGDDLRTGDGTQAFVLLADLVVNPKDAGAVDPALRNAVQERQRLFQPFFDARHRLESAV
jgi:hypothetical protein